MAARKRARMIMSIRAIVGFALAGNYSAGMK
jgi:hypothetical protein